jgi:hypothetical protein
LLIKPLLSKQAQTGRYARQKYRKPKTPESTLQSFTDDYLSALKIKYTRIPEGFWSFLHAVAHGTAFLAAFRKSFGGQPDNQCFIPVSNKYSLTLSLELKSASGRLHGRQKAEAKRLPWQIARTPEEVRKIVSDFQKEAKRVGDYLGDGEKP